MERRLGRGLGSLLGQPEAERNPAGVESVSGAQELPLKSIRPNPGQPRKVFDSDHLEQLRQSIAQHGVLQPILVRPVDDGFEIISGERRWRAARLAGQDTIPAVVRQADDAETLELAIVENVQRRDLDPMEKARGFQVLADQFGLTQDAIAEKVGLQRSSVANHLRLLDLPEKVQEGVSAGLVSMGHARALLGVKDRKVQLAAFEKVARQELSVRETERLVRALAGPALAASGVRPAARDPWQGTLESRMRDHLGARVELKAGKTYRGKIVVHFKGREELERLSELLGPGDKL